MLALAITTVLFSGLPLCGGGQAETLFPSTVGSDSLERLYQSGRTFADFLAAAKSRREAWHGNYARATVSPELLQRARAVPGRWRLLVVAEDWCGDSANTIPYIAGLTDSVFSLELRVVNARAGKWVMERYRTPDGRAATPTVVVLDSTGVAAGCFVERPAELRKWLAGNQGRLSQGKLQQGKEAWRRRDAGQATVREVVELLESAARGSPSCGPIQ
jgi:hypothetical protein